MKKVGILNFQFSTYNYGAVLQAAALEEVIKNLGYDAEHINLISEYKPSLVGKLKLRIRKCLSMIKQTLFFRNRKPIENILVVHNSEVFEEFRQKWLTRTPQVFNHVKQLEIVKSRYDAVVVGSDQVWRLKAIQNYESAYYLGFLSPETVRISYAASFGVDYWEDDVTSKLTKRIAEYVKKFRFVSVREKSGVELCRDLFGVNATHVVDPTLLVDRTFFDSIVESEIIDEKPADVVYYKLDIEPSFTKLLNELSVEKGLTYENIYYGENLDGSFSYISVPNWLKKIRDAKYVVTDSFHCICFAIVFGKQFLYYPNNFRGMSRLESLLGFLDLKERIYNGKDFSKMLESQINYEQVNNALYAFKEDSRAFLTNALSG